MKRLALFVCCVLSITLSSAQSNLFLADKVTGNLYRPDKNAGIEGSAMFLEYWAPGVIYLKDGYRADKFRLKYDQYSSELLFEHEGQPLAVVNPVKEFTLSPPGQTYLFRSGYLPIDKNTEATYYQVLADGPTVLLKHARKSINERKEYNKAATIKEFITTETYYIARPKGEIIQIKKGRESMLEALGYNQKLEGWMKQNKIRVRSEEEMIAVVNYFNQNIQK
jgi:hypothetical protein